MVYLCLLTCVVQELLLCTCSTFVTIGQAQHFAQWQDVYVPGLVGRCSKDLSGVVNYEPAGRSTGVQAEASLLCNCTPFLDPVVT